MIGRSDGAVESEYAVCRGYSDCAGSGSSGRSAGATSDSPSAASAPGPGSAPSAGSSAGAAGAPVRTLRSDTVFGCSRPVTRKATITISTAAFRMISAQTVGPRRRRGRRCRISGNGVSPRPGSMPLLESAEDANDPPKPPAMTCLPLDEPTPAAASVSALRTSPSNPVVPRSGARGADRLAGAAGRSGIRAGSTPNTWRATAASSRFG